LVVASCTKECVRCNIHALRAGPDAGLEGVLGLEGYWGL